MQLLPSHSIKNRNNDEIRVKDLIWIVVIVAYCMNFINIGSYTPVLILPVVILYVMKNKFTLTFINTSLILLGFGIVYSFFLFMYQYGSNLSILGKSIYPFCFFILGYKLINGDGDYNKTYRYLLFIIVSFTAFGFFCVIKTISVFGSMDVARAAIGRAVINVWDSNVISATILNMSLSFGLSLLSILFMSFKAIEHGRKIKLISLLCFLISTYSIVILGNRTGLVIIVASFIVAIALTLKYNGKTFRNIFVLSGVLLLTAISYSQNVFGLKTKTESTNLYMRMNNGILTEDPRIEAWETAFNGIFRFPLGGKEAELPLNFAHNMWLDVGYEGGLFPFSLLLILTLISLRTLWVFIRRDNPIILKRLFIGLYTSSFITFFMEPIMQGGFVYFTIFCFIFGVVQCLNSQHIQLKKRTNT